MHSVYLKYYTISQIIRRINRFAGVPVWTRVCFVCFTLLWDVFTLHMRVLQVCSLLDAEIHWLLPSHAVISALVLHRSRIELRSKSRKRCPRRNVLLPRGSWRVECVVFFRRPCCIFGHLCLRPSLIMRGRWSRFPRRSGPYACNIATNKSKLWKKTRFPAVVFFCGIFWWK